MQIKITDNAPFQVLSNAFSISPSATGYDLQVSADGINYSTLFAVSANTTRMVTGIANGSFFRCSGNVGNIIVNWERECHDGQGGGGTAGVSSLDGQTGALTTKTINNQSILGSGNIEIDGGSGDYSIVDGAIPESMETEGKMVYNLDNQTVSETVTGSNNGYKVSFPSDVDHIIEYKWDDGMVASYLFLQDGEVHFADTWGNNYRVEADGKYRLYGQDEDHNWMYVAYDGDHTVGALPYRLSQPEQYLSVGNGCEILETFQTISIENVTLKSGLHIYKDNSWGEVIVPQLNLDSNYSTNEWDVIVDAYNNGRPYSIIASHQGRNLTNGQIRNVSNTEFYAVFDFYDGGDMFYLVSYICRRDGTAEGYGDGYIAVKDNRYIELKDKGVAVPAGDEYTLDGTDWFSTYEGNMITAQGDWILRNEIWGRLMDDTWNIITIPEGQTEGPWMSWTRYGCTVYVKAFANGENGVKYKVRVSGQDWTIDEAAQQYFSEPTQAEAIYIGNTLKVTNLMAQGQEGTPVRSLDLDYVIVDGKKVYGATVIKIEEDNEGYHTDMTASEIYEGVKTGNVLLKLETEYFVPTYIQYEPDVLNFFIQYQSPYDPALDVRIDDEGNVKVERESYSSIMSNIEDERFVSNITCLSQAEYDALENKGPVTLYIIVD